MAAQAAHSLGHPPAWSGGRGVPDGWDWADTPEYMPLPDAIWTHVPSILILMNPLGTSPARDLMSQIPTGTGLLGTVPLIYANLSSTDRVGI